ncbi:leucine-rich repeat flightless-interacting protein 2 isoform X5 [Leucoraja erinacea]|uniref:leucine-rich repeat flightless-interacting protein 2 isoform X5 n=1 Tax=Leucoraja erinaceus TaxID=7782 RepID=UPI0024579A03|nr:leucine-rich repeat flightless-interacting protein 2 isoform X5 [Leucoraja erinacea]
MGTPGAGRKRTPIKDRFSAEDEALSHIAREAEARLAAKRAARAEARDIRMKELERQQKELYRSSNRKWGEIHQWMENTERAKHSFRPHQHYLVCEHFFSSIFIVDISSIHSHLFYFCFNQTADDAFSVRSASSQRLDEKTESFSRPASRNAVSGLSAATLASLGGSSSRRGSGDMSSILDPDVSLSEMRDIYELKDQIQDVEGRYMQGLKELKDSLSEVEEKYKKAMVSNAQLDNDKSNLIYQVDTLKDVIEEMEEQMAELYRENEDKSKELERQKHMYHVSQHKVEELKEGIRQRDELIEALERQKDYFDCIRNERDELRDELADLRERKKNHGLVIIPESTPNGDINHEPVVGAITVVSQEAAHVLEGAGDGPLDVRLKKLADEKEELLAQIRKLKLQLEEERQKSSKVENVLTDSDRLENGTDLQILEMQRDANRQLSEYKFKLSKAEQDFATVEQNVARLEGQLHRYKSATENSEKVEDELKAEKRRLQRELRLALDKNEEMEMTNSHLVKRLEKMKANRNALLSQQ